MTRQQFLLLTAASLCAAGCEALNPGTAAAGAGGPPRVVDAGPAAQYAGEGVYAGFVSQGFFVVRREGKLLALSSYCTHRHCKLEAEADRTFYCPCHGSTFDPAGKVTEGPATRDLPVLALAINAAGHVLVTVA